MGTVEQWAGAGPEAALWQCERCHAWTQRGQVHSCPNSDGRDRATRIIRAATAYVEAADDDPAIPALYEALAAAVRG